MDRHRAPQTIAKYTKDFIVENMGVPAELITNVYNGTDTAKFKRTPEMAGIALERYPCATPDNAFVVGCIGSYEERKAQSLLLKVRDEHPRAPQISLLPWPSMACFFSSTPPTYACTVVRLWMFRQAAKSLIDSGKLPNIHCLFVGEGPDKEMLQKMITDDGCASRARSSDSTLYFLLSRARSSDLLVVPSMLPSSSRARSSGLTLVPSLPAGLDPPTSGSSHPLLPSACLRSPGGRRTVPRSLENNATLCEFTKEPFYVCNLPQSPPISLLPLPCLTSSLQRCPPAISLNLPISPISLLTSARTAPTCRSSSGATSSPCRLQARRVCPTCCSRRWRWRSRAWLQQSMACLRSSSMG